MILKLLFLTFTGLTIIHSKERGKFVRTIEAVGLPYYRILMSLGGCKETILWDEQKAWGTARLNRLLDIKYKSKHTLSLRSLDVHLSDCLKLAGEFFSLVKGKETFEQKKSNNQKEAEERILRKKRIRDDYKVSRVEIKLVINNTDCFAYSEWGVGGEEFTATVFVPTKVAVILYHLTIFTCSRVSSTSDERRDEQITPKDLVYDMLRSTKENPLKMGIEEKEEQENFAEFDEFDIGPDRGPHHLVLDQV